MEWAFHSSLITLSSPGRGLCFPYSGPFSAVSIFLALNILHKAVEGAAPSACPPPPPPRGSPRTSGTLNLGNSTSYSP